MAGRSRVGMRLGVRRAGLVAAAVVTVSAALAGPAAAHSAARPPVTDRVHITGADCNVVSPSYCMLDWDTAQGDFEATGVHAEGSALVLDGLFTGRRGTPYPWLQGRSVDVKGQAATVPVGSVTVSRRTVVLKGADWPSDCGATGVSCTINTNAVSMTDTSLGDVEMMSYREQPFAVTGHPSRTSARHATRDWRRAKTAAARAAVLERLLFSK